MGVDQPDVRSKMILVSDNGCHIWTIAIVELQNSIFLFTILSNQTHYCRPWINS
jgi:hypothetical protein